jgi:hypothetical protein
MVRRWTFGGPISIFGKVAFQFMDCPEFSAGRDKKLPGVVLMENLMRDLNRRQDKDPGIRGFLLVRVKDG